jgi:GT2 family glycosyltransferase
MNPLDLSIITVNYNGAKDTGVMIESLHDNLSIPYEIIVVDNGSRENEAVLLQESYPFIKAIRSEKNLGFAGGNNVGIEAASGEYLFFLNNDTYVQDGSISHLLDALKRDSSLGGISPKILFADEEGGIQFAGYTPLSRVTLRNRLIGCRESDKGQHDVVSATPYMHGAAMLVRREAITKAGKMPELYFLYYEELDWSVRIRQAGYRLEYHPSATVYHRESSSTGQESPLKIFYMTRNRLLFARRNLTGWQRVLSIVYQVGIAIPKGILTSLLKGRFSLVKATVKGCASFFKIHSS